MSFPLYFVLLPKKFNVLAWFQASGAPRPKNADSGETDALFDLDTQIIISYSPKFEKFRK
jgi:hypothetical protein